MIDYNMEVKIFKALAHPIRLKIIKKLKQGTLCVCELNQDVEFSQSNLSQHLKILKGAGIVIYEKEGLRINYSIKDAKILQILDTVDEIIIKDIKEMNEKLINK